MVVGIVTLMLLSLMGAFFTGRRYPYTAALDAEYNEGMSDEQRKWLRDEMKADQRAQATAPAPVVAEPPANTGTYEYLYDPDAKLKKPSWTYAASSVPVPDPTEALPDDDDVEAATNFFTSLAEDGCGVCEAGAPGDCTCTDICDSRMCRGWSHSATITSHAGEEYRYSPEAVDTAVMCDRMDREVEDYLMKMKADTGAYISKVRVEEARSYYCEVVGAQEDSPTKQEIGSWTEPMKAITA